MTDPNTRSTCHSTYSEGSWTWRCDRARGHQDAGLLHSGWSTGRTREWTDEQANEEIPASESNDG